MMIDDMLKTTVSAAKRAQKMPMGSVGKGLSGINHNVSFAEKFTRNIGSGTKKTNTYLKRNNTLAMKSRAKMLFPASSGYSKSSDILSGEATARDFRNKLNSAANRVNLSPNKGRGIHETLINEKLGKQKIASNQNIGKNIGNPNKFMNSYDVLGKESARTTAKTRAKTTSSASRIIDAMPSPAGVNPVLHNAKMKDVNAKREAFKNRKPRLSERLFSGRGRESVEAADNLGRSGKAFMKGITEREGGWRAIAGNVGSGAVAGGITGAAVNTLRGEDAWEGAKTGAFYGGIGYGGVQAVRAGVKAEASETMVDAVKRFNKTYGVSKDVRTLMRDAKTHAIAKSVTDNKNK